MEIGSFSVEWRPGLGMIIYSPAPLDYNVRLRRLLLERRS